MRPKINWPRHRRTKIVAGKEKTMSQINATGTNAPVSSLGVTGAADPALAAEELLIDQMYNNGLAAIAKQDEMLATLYNEMLQQTQKLEDYSAAQQCLNEIAQARRDGGGKVPLSAKVITAVHNMIDDGLISLQEAKEIFGFTFDSPQITYPYQYDHVLNISDDKSKLGQIEALQKSISEEQASVGAVNEQQNLKINEAVGKRSAVFTQLQTVLNAIIQARANLARW
jgi:hypothetical protein